MNSEPDASVFRLTSRQGGGGDPRFEVAPDPWRPLRFRRLVRFSNAFLMLTKAPVFRGFHFYLAWRMRCSTAENAH